MRLLFLGDIVGRVGRQAVVSRVPALRKELALDAVVVNGENSAGGFGINEKISRQLFEAGVDVITTGNHIWDQKDVIGYLEREERLLRPINYPPGSPGRGAGLFELRNGQRLAVLNIMGRLFMDPLDDPFRMVDEALEDLRLGEVADAILVDFHAETTSEKMAFGHYVDGRVSLVVGTHTHVPTADAMVLPGGTGYQTDAGMCGDYDSVIGMDKAEPMQRFARKISSMRFEPALGEATICGVVCAFGSDGLCTSIEAIRLGGRLAPTHDLETVLS